MKNSVSIITLVKHEHDFINPWIEYHIKLGVSHFYILIDNILDEQPEYNINCEFKDSVTLIKCDQSDVVKHFGHTIQHFCQLPNFHISGILHSLMNTKIIECNTIKEDWTTAIGVDQYLYMNGETIQMYLENIDESCDQIIMPWSIVAFNNKNMPHDNLIKNVGRYTCCYGHVGHSNGLMKTKNLLKLAGNSHSFISKKPRQKVYIINEYFEMNSKLISMGSNNVFDIVQKKMDEINLHELKISSFHFFIRNFQEIIIKNCFYWNRTLSNFDDVVHNITTNTKSILHSYHRTGMQVVEQYKFLQNIDIPLVSCINTYTHYDNLIITKLKDYNINEQEYHKWLQIPP